MQKAVCVQTEVFAATGAARSVIDITVRAAFCVCSFLPTENAKTASSDRHTTAIQLVVDGFSTSVDG